MERQRERAEQANERRSQRLDCTEPWNGPVPHSQRGLTHVQNSTFIPGVNGNEYTILPFQNVTGVPDQSEVELDNATVHSFYSSALAESAVRGIFMLEDFNRKCAIEIDNQTDAVAADVRDTTHRVLQLLPLLFRQFQKDLRLPILSFLSAHMAADEVVRR